MASPLYAQESAPAADAAVPKENPELEAEISYVEALVNNGYPDFAEPIMVATKKKWPESEVRFFAIEIRGMLALGKFEDAEKKIAALPDRKCWKYWAARLEVANNYFGRGQKKECLKIYDEFFKVFQKPPKELVKFYMEASYAYGQLLIGEKQYAKAVQRYASLLTQLRVGDDNWCSMACETVDLYLRLATAASEPAKKAERDKHLAAATKIIDQLLWQLEKPVYFGRAVSMKAHAEQLKGDVVRAAAIIDEYKPQLQELHEQILQIDADGKFGLLKQSPLPECMYLQAKMIWDEALIESKKKPRRDDEKIKSYMFGPRGPNKKRIGSKGAFNLALNVFLNYETSAWAAAAGDLSEEIRAFAEKEYKAKIKTHVTKEQIAKVRAAQFREADEKFMSGQQPLEAIEAYYQVLAKYPELHESIPAIEHIVSAYLDLLVDSKDKVKKEEYRLNIDAIEGYLASRFADSKDKYMMTAAGDATIRLAAKEQEYRFFARAEALLRDFCMNCSRHPNAPTTAAAKAMELQKAGKYEAAKSFWSIIINQYTNSAQYAVSYAQMAACCGELGDSAGEIENLTKYIGIESVKIRKLQAKFQLAQKYQKGGLDILDNAATNAVPEEVEALEKQGTAQIVRAIKEFSGFSAEADAALKDAMTSKEDAAKYKQLKEAALCIVGECWSRMNRPEKNLKAYRERAAKAYEEYVSTFPMGKYAKMGYVKLGTIYTALGDMEKSKGALDRLSKQFPDSDEAKDAKPRLAKSLIAMGLKREGAEIYSEMLRTDGDYTPMQFVNAGEALIEAKNWELANQAFEKAINLAGTNSLTAVARARLGQAKSVWRQGSLPEAREHLDNFLKDEKLSRLSIAADANFMLVEIASEQGRTEKDNQLRKKYFNAAIGALKKVRQYWRGKPRWEQDQLDLMSGDVLISRMKAEETMGLKEEAQETCGRAASTFQVFIQAHGVSPEHPIEKMDEGELKNLERAYATMIPLFSQLGSVQADRVMKFGQEYLELFPEGAAKTEVINCMNKAKADLPAAEAK